MATRRDTELILRDLGSTQHGVVARTHLLERGLSAHAVDRLVRARRLLVVQRGVYQVSPCSSRERPKQPPSLRAAPARD
jgi:hypothetical protein